MTRNRRRLAGLTTLLLTILVTGAACDDEQPAGPTTPLPGPATTTPRTAPPNTRTVPPRQPPRTTRPANPQTTCHGPSDPLCDKAIEVPPPDLRPW